MLRVAVEECCEAPGARSNRRAKQRKRSIAAWGVKGFEDCGFEALGFEDCGLEVEGLGFRVWGLRLKASGLGFRAG